MEDYLFNKNFKFDGIDQLKNKTSLYRYKLKTDLSKKQELNYDVIAKQFKNDTCYEATFTTTNENNYFDLKNSIKSAGFILMRTIDEDGMDSLA